MNAFKNYISSFFSGLSSLLKGMRVTIRVFFRKKTTEQYPENRDTLQIFDRFRGALVMRDLSDELPERIDQGDLRDRNRRGG